MESQLQGSFVPSVLLRTILVAKVSKLNAEAQEAISHTYGLQSPEFCAECVHSLITNGDKCWKLHGGFVEK
jgi:hypothetical protein